MSETGARLVRLVILASLSSLRADAISADEVKAIVTGTHHTCALTTGGAVKCWGRNDRGQLGTGTTSSHSSKPVEVVGLQSGIAAISLSGDHTCVITDAGGVKCWGLNAWGQIGDGTHNNVRTAPVEVPGLSSGVKAIAAGHDHTCALTAGGAVKCWGLNSYGQVGNGTSGNAWLGPVDVTGLGADVLGIAAGGLHTCAVLGGGTLKCWGSNFNGQLGIGTPPQTPPDQAQCTSGTYAGCRATAADIPAAGTNIATVAAGGAETCVTTSAGAVRCWGYNAFGQVGNGTVSTSPPNYPQPSPVDVAGLAGGIAAVSAGGSPCAVTTSGAAKCWGLNDVGQVGDGTTTKRSVPVDVFGLATGVAGIDAGRHTCAVTTSGAAKCWGANDYGQLGNWTTTGQFVPSPLPVDVIFGPTVTTQDAWVVTDIDRINRQVCPLGSELKFTLSGDATVTIKIDGQAIQQDVPRPAGPNSIPLDPSMVSAPGEHDFEVIATFEIGGTSTQLAATGHIHHEVLMHASFPVAHTIVKGVDIWDGHLTHTAQDVAIPGRGLSLEFVRTYSSAGTSSDTPLGGGWTHNYYSRLVQDACGRYVVIGGEGTGNAFTFDGGAFRPQIGYHSTLLRDPQDSGKFDFFTKARVRYRFERDLLLPGEVYTLRFIEEPNGNRLTLDYVGGDGDPTTLDAVTDSSGRSLVFEHQQLLQRKRIVRMRGRSGPTGGDLLGLEVVYDYDAFGNLIRVVRKSPDAAAGFNDERIQTYAYTSGDRRDRHNLRLYTDPNGNTTEYVYHLPADNLPGSLAFGVLPHEVVKTIWQPEGAVTEFTYDFGAGRRTVSDPRAPQEAIPPTLYVVNGYGATVRIEAPLGKVTTMAWCTEAPHPSCPDRSGNPGLDALMVSMIDAEGRTHRYAYADRLGNLTKETIVFTGDKTPVTLADATTPVSEISTTYSYEPTFSKVTSKIDPEGNTTFYLIDAAGAPTFCPDPTPARDTGNLLGVKDAEGNVTCYAYAGNGDLLSVTDPRGLMTRYVEYDAYGNRTRIEDALGNIFAAGYDERSRLRESSDTFTHHTIYAYDGLDRKVREEKRDDLGEQGQSQVGTLRYRPNGEVEATVDRLEHVTRYLYDGLNRPIERGEERVLQADGSNAVLRTLFSYDAAGNMRTETDPRGVVRLHTYDALGRRVRTEVQGAFGPNQTILSSTYDLVDNKLTETDLHGHTTGYLYDGLYRVVNEQLALPGAAITYGYDRGGNIVRQTDPNGHTRTYAYDRLYRPKRVTEPNGTTILYAYDAAGNKTREESLTTQLVTEYLDYDGLNRLLRRRESGPGLPPGGYVTSAAFEDNDNAVIVTNPRGTRTRSDRDGLDRVVRTIVDVDGLALTTTLTYDANGNLATVRDPQGGDVDLTHQYDGLNRKIRSTYVATPDDGAQPITEEFVYDGASNLIRYKDKRGTVFTKSYDNLGREVAEKVQEHISNAGAELTLHTTAFDDPAGKQSDVDANGNVTVTYVDAFHRARVIDDPGPNAPFDPAGPGPFPVGVTWFEYDGVNRRAAVNRRGHRTEFAYDSLNRLVETREFDLTGSLKTTLRVEYLDAENQRRETDRRGLLRTSRFDALQRLVEVRHSGGDMAARYRAAEVVLERHEYDGSGNRTAVVDGNGNRTEFGYDAAGRLLEVTTAAGTSVAATVKTTYDKAGNVLTVKDGRNHGGAFDLRYEYDPRYRLVAVTNGQVETTAYRYDANDNPLEVTEPKGHAFRTLYRYDELNKLLAVDESGRAGPTTPAGVTRFFRDGNRNPLAQQDANASLVTFRYDALNRLIDTFQHTVPGCLTDQTARGPTPAALPGSCGDEATALRWRYGYDLNGNQNSIVDARGQGVEMSYDHLDRLTRKTYSQHATPTADFQPLSIAYTYDGNGNAESITETKRRGGASITEVTLQTFDALDRVSSRTRRDYDDTAGKQLEFRYDIQGNRTAVVDPDGHTTTYAYDGQNRLEAVTSDAGLTRYGYWEDSLLKSVEYPNGVRCDYSDPAAYDRADRLRSVVNRPADPALPAFSGYTYTYDENGNRLTQVETQRAFDGGIPQTTTYQYDNLNRLAGVTYGTSGSLAFTYEPNGNRKTEQGTDPHTGQPVSRTYRYVALPDKPGRTFDHVNALSQVVDNLDPSRTVTYEYDRNLNLTAREKAGLREEFGFGIRDELLSVNGPGGSGLTFDYDHQRLRSKKVPSAGGETRFLYDGSFPLLEYDGSAPDRTLRKYEYGEDALLSATEIDSTGSRRSQFYLKDGLGSTANLTDEAGGLRHSYRYDAWGGLRAEAGDSSNPRQYTGHYRDAETALHYFGARYYDSETGRFLSQDAYPGEPDLPASLHRHLYAYANPLRFVDPLGYASEERNRKPRCIGELCQQSDGTWVNRGDEITQAEVRNPCEGVGGPCNPRTKEVDDYVAAENRRYLKRAMAEIEPLKASLDRAYKLRAHYWRFVDAVQREEQRAATAEREALLAALDEAQSGGYGDMAMFFAEQFAETVHEAGVAARAPLLGDVLAASIHTVGAILTAPLNFGAGAGAVTGKVQAGQPIALEDALMLASDVLQVAEVGLAVRGTMRVAVVRDARAVLGREFAEMAGELSAPAAQDVLRSASASGLLPPTGIPRFDRLAVDMPEFGRWRSNMEGRGFTVEPKQLPAGNAANVDPVTRIIDYDPTQFRYIDLLHESRHVRQVEKATGLKVRVGPGEFKLVQPGAAPERAWRTRELAWMERGAYEYEQRLTLLPPLRQAERVPFSSEYKDFVIDQANTYWKRGYRKEMLWSESMRRYFASIWK